MKRTSLRLALVALMGLSVPVMAAGPWYVRNGGDDSVGDGASWGTAWATIGKALSVAANGESVLVSNGSYLITAELAVTNGVILTGIGGAEQTVVARTGNQTNRIFRIAHVDAVLDGFTVSNGFVNGNNTNGYPLGMAPTNQHGAGIHMSPGGAVRNCWIVGNNATNGSVLGGGIYMTGGVVSNCVVWSNGVYTGTGQNRIMYGGGIYMTGGQVVDCAIVSNLAFQHGFGLYVVTGTVDRCRIVGNRGDNRGYQGGGAMLNSTSAVIRNSLIANNTARAGGGLWVNYGLVENCTVVSNAGGNHSGGIYAVNSSTIRNTIIARNSSPPLCRDYHPGAATYRYCCASPLLPGEGNIEADPQFVNPAISDYRLLPGSTCLDAGTNLDWVAGAKDLDSAARLPDVRVDMGAFESAPGPLAANMIASGLKAFGPTDIVFTAYAAGTNTDSLTYYWDFNGDGTQEISGATAAVATNSYAAGTYTVRLSVTNAAGEGVTVRKPAYVKIAPVTIYASTSSIPVFPYTSWATASTNIQKAIDAGIDGSTVRVTDGVFEVGVEIGLNEGVTLRSENGAGKTTLTQKSNYFTVFLSHANAVVDGFTINRKGGYGGVQIVQLGTVRNSIIAGNRDEVGNGPVNLTGGGLVTDCLIITNSSRNYGGVRIQAQSGGYYVTGIVANCMIISNQANHATTTTKGVVGGIRGELQSVIRNCVIAGNLSFGFDGGAYLDGGIMENCTLVGNVASNAAATAVGGLRTLSTLSPTLVRNTIISGNTNIVTGSAVNYSREGGTIEYSCTTPSAAAYGGGNITAQPVFMNAPTGDYRLAAGSPGVNQGTNVSWMLTATDLAGNPRIGQKQVDMGAYERLSVATGALMLVR